MAVEQRGSGDNTDRISGCILHKIASNYRAKVKQNWCPPVLGIANAIKEWQMQNPKAAPSLKKERFFAALSK